jgi:hypothetical protein
MNKPRKAQLFNLDEYWPEVEKDRAEKGLPSWCFDFISVHSSMARSVFTLVSPMMLVDKTGDRPDFEDDSHPTKKAAIRRARELARQHNTFVVVCP